MVNIIGIWKSIMDSRYNPLKYLDLPGKHHAMQLLAWMWSMIFSISFLSIFEFGIVWISHVLIVGGIFATHAVFTRAAKRRPALPPVPELSHASKTVWKMDVEA